MGYRFNPQSTGTPADWELWSRMIADGRRWRFVDRIVHRYYPAVVAPVCDPQ